MDTSLGPRHDGAVKPFYPGGQEPDPRAVPGVRPRSEAEAAPPGLVLEVDGEQFAVRSDEYGGTDYTWVSGRNPGYGFTESPTQHRSLEEHRAAVRAFLADIDPVTGFLEEQ